MRKMPASHANPKRQVALPPFHQAAFPTGLSKHEHKHTARRSDHALDLDLTIGKARARPPSVGG